jgi:hypothetical protein
LLNVNLWRGIEFLLLLISKQPELIGSCHESFIAQGWSERQCLKEPADWFSRPIQKGIQRRNVRIRCRRFSVGLALSDRNVGSGRYEFGLAWRQSAGDRVDSCYCVISATIAHPTPMPSIKYRHLSRSLRSCQAKIAVIKPTAARTR